MKTEDYCRKLGLRALCIVGLLTWLDIACTNTQAAEKVQTLFIDATRTQGKVYLCQVSREKLLVDDIFGEQRIRWIAANSRGQAVYSHSAPAESAAWRLNLMATVEPIPIEGSSNLPSEPRAALSPDGTRICFRKTDGVTDTIEVLDFKLGRLDKVFSGNGPVSPPSWSPDGMSIAYYFGDTTAAVDDSFSVGIAEPGENGWNHRTVAPPSKLGSRSPIRPNAPIWGPHGRALLFHARYRDDERGLQVYMVSTDGSDLVRLCDPAGTPSSHAAGKILFSDPKEGVFSHDAYKRDVSKLFTKKSVFYPKLSPDAKFVAYSDSEGVIFVVNSDGSNPRKIVDTASAVPNGEFHWLFLREASGWRFWAILIVAAVAIVIAGLVLLLKKKASSHGK